MEQTTVSPFQKRADFSTLKRAKKLIFSDPGCDPYVTRADYSMTDSSLPCSFFINPLFVNLTLRHSTADGC
jgi:hypothetical protein